jgi:hypothetical protein
MGESIENRTVPRIIGAEFERIKKTNQHGAIVRPVGAPHDRMELLPIGRPGGLELPHEIPKLRLVRNRVNHLFDRIVRTVERGLGDLKE